MYKSIYKSEIGNIYLISDGLYLTHLFIEGQNSKINLKTLKLNDNLEIFKSVKKWLDMYFNKEIPNINIKMKLNGTIFQRKVWKILKTIPYGKTITYKDIRNILDKTKKLSCQAVGNAINKNPISIIIPCHRVIGSNNKLIGYNGGINIKRYFLELENNVI